MRSNRQTRQSTVAAQLKLDRVTYQARNGAKAATGRKRDAADAELDPDIDNNSISPLAVPENPIISGPDFRIAVDLGNSNTAVAIHKDGMSTEVIPIIDDYPGEPDPTGTNRQVPTLILYPKGDAQVTNSVVAEDMRIRFGHEVTQILNESETDDVCGLYDQNNVVSMMKLQLDDTEYASEAKKGLLSKLEELKRLGHIKENTDVIRDFLSLVLKHTKSRLIRDFGYEDGNTVEIVISVPVCWTPRSTATMSKAVEDAARAVGLGTDEMSPCNIFIANEPELQSMHALRLRTAYALQPGDVFLLADCGGATLDLALFGISQTNPIRLQAEVLEQEGYMLGSNQINEACRDSIIKLLQFNDRHKPLEKMSGLSLRTIVDTEIMPRFESKVKRAFESTDSTFSATFQVRGLESDPDDQRLRINKLKLSSNDIAQFFEPTVTQIIRRVAELARKSIFVKGSEIDKIVLTGGFGDSPYLRTEFTKMISRLNKAWGTSIQPAFSPPNSSATGVIVGGIHRSIDKAYGPQRQPSQEREKNPDTKVEYLTDTIEWPIKKNQGILAPIHFFTYLSEFIFSPNESWIRCEKFFVSEKLMEDFLKRDNLAVKDFITDLGDVWFNLTHLKKEIQAHNRKQRLRQNSVILRIEVRIIGRNLEFTARWPPVPDGQQIQGTCRYFSVAAALPVGAE
ncbi:hypothetical protein OPT61_g6674 [Boeremia exigua]|uniref:Uncharacterized protein n=1 Tax=Boeremia exigua TaxID=749465 RepID=A0ACC2I639_9PLEO|nr:hypothetical protein OPT61_g6674 [Boeremia exigua]